ncbi:MAG: hypothetical protein ACI86H_000183 [bacterium]|jgi:hypothetical protein
MNMIGRANEGKMNLFQNKFLKEKETIYTIGIVTCGNWKKGCNFKKLQGLSRILTNRFGTPEVFIVKKEEEQQKISLTGEQKMLEDLSLLHKKINKNIIIPISYPIELAYFFDYYVVCFQNTACCLIEPEDYFKSCSHAC